MAKWIIKTQHWTQEIQTWVMRRSQNFIRFGDYRFVLEFISQGQDKIKVGSSGYPGLHPSPSFKPDPLAYSKTSWNIWLQSKIPGTSIKAGVNIYTGEPVAVKQLKIKIASLPYTSSRLRSLAIIIRSKTMACLAL